MNAALARTNQELGVSQEGNLERRWMTLRGSIGAWARNRSTIRQAGVIATHGRGASMIEGRWISEKSRGCMPKREPATGTATSEWTAVTSPSAARTMAIP